MHTILLACDGEVCMRLLASRIEDLPKARSEPQCD